MMIIGSLISSIKDYVEIVHKLVETNEISNLVTYYDLGQIGSFCSLLLKEKFDDIKLLTYRIQDAWSISPLIPDIASSMISEISIFDGFFKDNPIMGLLEKPYLFNLIGTENLFIYCLEKFIIGLLNSIFLSLATCTSSIIILRRFVMQGLEAGYLAGLGVILGNIVWIGSIIFGLRFVVIPWLSLDILRYILGFLLLMKYMWDSYSERRSVLTDFSKKKIFLFHFFLAFTEQTNIFPFLNTISIGSNPIGLFGSFPPMGNNDIIGFFLIHGFYILGLAIGSLSLLQFLCWFWENPAYNIYIWTISKIPLDSSKFFNFLFLYLTMICTFNAMGGYFSLDYPIGNLGFVHEDRLMEQKMLLETSFLNSKPSDRNTRRNRGRHGRRERWKRRVRSYRTFDASLYNNGVYDLFTLEDLNYGFDRFWLRRKIRNHRVRFRFFPGPWMRSLKKEFARPRLESFIGPRVEFFRILFEQAYDPEFHEFNSSILSKNQIYPIIQNPQNLQFQNIAINSFLRKFLRKTDNRLKFHQLQNLVIPIYDSLPLRSLLDISSEIKLITKNLSKKNLSAYPIRLLDRMNSTQKKFSKSYEFMAEYKNSLKTKEFIPFLHPLKFYIQKHKAFRKKCQFYGVKQYRTYNVENNAPYFRVMMKRFFYYYKPTLRWERTMRVATMRKARRKGSRVATLYPRTPRDIFHHPKSTFQKPINSLSNLIIGKKATRYRYQIYKDVLQHWYYNKINRLLLKFDIDYFIKRQPKFHNLTKNEESFLHIKRFFLYDYYNSFRWYNFMQHYNTMKKVVNKTKSFSNLPYNQQFFGTFKKIRHLFSITPSFNQKVLKFDQPLYNEFESNSTLNSLIHEELKTIIDIKTKNYKINKLISSNNPINSDNNIYYSTNKFTNYLIGLDKYQNKLYNQKALKEFLVMTSPLGIDPIGNLLMGDKIKKILKTRLEKCYLYNSKSIIDSSFINLSNSPRISTFPSTQLIAIQAAISNKLIIAIDRINRNKIASYPIRFYNNITYRIPINKSPIIGLVNKLPIYKKNLESGAIRYQFNSLLREKVFNNRKKIRKTLKKLKNNQNFKIHKYSTLDKLNTQFYKKLDQNWGSYISSQKNISWKKRRSRIRRSRFFKGRGPIRKSYSIRLLDRKNPIGSKNQFSPISMKQSRTIIKKHRYWKKHKKPIIAQNKRKLRKKRRYLKSKMRVLAKKLKKVEFQLFIKKWWWQTFLPQNKINGTLSIGKLKFDPLNNITKKPILLLGKSIYPFKTYPININDRQFIIPSIKKNPIGLSNIIPFYAGWDETDRKFVITNRLLSIKNTNHGFLNSMNAATTMARQIPFTTYDPDQFFALGMDGFSPIGWKNFTFLKTTKPILVQTLSTIKIPIGINPIDRQIPINSAINKLSLDLKIKALFPGNKIGGLFVSNNKKFHRFNQIISNRRIQKPYKRVKKHPRPPVWFPSGAINLQILPVHYIYVFYKRYGLPRDRYIRRKLRANKNEYFTPNSTLSITYTFRKRVKPKRKYHRKNNKLNPILIGSSYKILRRPFRGYANDLIENNSTRPKSYNLFLLANNRKKFQTSKKKRNNENLRLRQLRRRVQRQVFRPVWRYKPINGGFIWPGDYLRLDNTIAPKLGFLGDSKIRKKKRRIIPEWQIQPKKYLFLSHNRKVFKKRLEKSK